MITKDRLLQMIQEAIRTEESAIPIYIKHISVSVPWFGFREEDREFIQNELRTLGQESAEHKRILEEVREAIIKEAKDVY